MTDRSNEPAYPTLIYEQYADKGTGMTIREKIAAMAMEGIVGDYQTGQRIVDTDPRYNGSNYSAVVAINAVEFADALIAELSKPQEK